MREFIAGLAHDEQHLDSNREVEVAHHAADHRRLLGVLLSEVGDVGVDDVEELGDDRGDAAEMLRAAAPGVAVEKLEVVAALFASWSYQSNRAASIMIEPGPML